MKENVYQIDCKVYLLDSVKFVNILYEISSFVDSALALDSEMLKFHNSYGYKNYVISGFKEIEHDKTYKEGKVYTFSVRCIQEELCKFLKEKLKDTQTDKMKGLVCTVKIIPKLFIEKLYTLTPALIKLDGKGYWKGVLSFEEFERLLFENSIKKYKKIFGDEIDENFSFYDRIVMLNNKPIANNYKEIKLLGDKFELYISDNERAQQLAYMLLGTGILENNARGYGYLNFTSLR